MKVEVRISASYISFFVGEGTKSYARFGPYGWTAKTAWKDYFRSARIWKNRM